MKEYIEREAALICVCEDCSGQNGCNVPCVDYVRIKSIPAADVVEVDVKDFRMKKAIQMLSHYYSVAKKSGRSEDPLSFALYMTWRIVEAMSETTIHGAKMDGGVNDG